MFIKKRVSIPYTLKEQHMLLVKHAECLLYKAVI